MDRIKSIAKLLEGKALAWAKAVVALIIGALVTYLAKYGIEVPTEISQALQAGVYGLVVAIWVWWVPNKQ